MAKATDNEKFVYGTVLDALSKGLYPDKRNVIREFVQNSCDAVREFDRRTGVTSVDPIEVRIQPPSITICDRGIGMSRKKVSEYRYVGFSEKDTTENVGFRGIGTISGIAVARRIVVTSTQFGHDEAFTVEIDGDGMWNSLKEQRNAPLDNLMTRFTSVKRQPAKPDDHYTFVQLERIRPDSRELFDAGILAEHLQQCLPLPFNPEFLEGKAISQELRTNVPDYFEGAVTLDDRPLYKPFLVEGQHPEYETIFFGEDTEKVLAFCWHIKHALPGQFSDERNRGLVYRVKNFAIGTAHLTRETLWRSTPARAFYYFGEIHLMDGGLVPSADRMHFEDNEARQRMYERCSRIAKVLNKRAGVESERDRLVSALDQADEKYRDQDRKLGTGEIPVEIAGQVEYEIRKTLEDLQKRLNRAKGKREPSPRDTKLLERGQKVQRKGRAVLRRLTAASAEGTLYDITKAVSLTGQSRKLYQLVVNVLNEELQAQPKILERLLRALQVAIKKRLR
jgi:hypothetical protein